MLAPTIVTPPEILTKPPKDSALYEGDYVQMVRVGTNYSPSFVLCVTGLNERKSAQKPPVIINGEYKELYLQWMQYKFFKENEAKFDPIYDLSQKCFKYEDFQKLLTEQSFFKDEKPIDLKDKITFLNQRLNAHEFFLKQLVGVVSVGLINQIEDFETVHAPDQPVPKEYEVALDIIREKMKAHKAASESLNIIQEGSKQLVSDIAKVRVNFSIVENVNASYEKLLGQLEEMFKTINNFVALYNETSEASQRLNLKDLLFKVTQIVKTLLDDLIWEKSAEFAVHQGHKTFGEQKYDDPLVSFMFYKHVEEKREDSFEPIVILVQNLRNRTKFAQKLIDLK